MDRLPNIHPGEVLREEFMLPLGLSQNALARALHVPLRRINEIVQKRRAVTADTALRLARYFGTTPQFWTGLQADFEKDPAGRIREIVAALDVLGHNPCIGHPLAGGDRELLIGRCAHGYVALYRYVEEIDVRACGSEPARSGLRAIGRRRLIGRKALPPLLSAPSSRCMARRAAAHSRRLARRRSGQAGQHGKAGGGCARPDRRARRLS
jgi:addiction module HigA family antidote